MIHLSSGCKIWILVSTRNLDIFITHYDISSILDSIVSHASKRLSFLIHIARISLNCNFFGLSNNLFLLFVAISHTWWEFSCFSPICCFLNLFYNNCLSYRCSCSFNIYDPIFFCVHCMSSQLPLSLPLNCLLDLWFDEWMWLVSASFCFSFCMQGPISYWYWSNKFLICSETSSRSIQKLS